MAVHAGDAGIVDELLAVGASVNALDFEELNPLQYAVRSGRCSVEIVGLLLQHHDRRKLNPSLQTDSASKSLFHYHLQSRLCSADIIRLILDHGADVNGIDSDGHSPLSLYLRSFHLGERGTICRLLLDHGACPLWTDRLGRKVSLLLFIVSLSFHD